MPEKKDSKKVMTMLERMGMVRKVGTDDELEQDTLSSDSRKEASQVPIETYPSPSAVDVPDDFWNDPPAQQPSYRPESEVPESVASGSEPDYTEPEQTYPIPESVSYSEPVRSSAAAERAPWEDLAATLVAEAEAEAAYTDRYMEINELYAAFSMKTVGTDTIYLVEDYMKSLPDSLPAESRRAIIMKIIGASGFDFDRLLGDGIDRVNKLNEYASQFARRTDDYVAKRNSELESLEQQMQQIRALIDKRKALHKQQFFSIESEAQRLKEILDFITK